MTPGSTDKPAPDLTPSVGSATDIAPISRTGEKPLHELTAAEDAQLVNWDEVAATEEFRGMLKAKLKFISSATILFVVYYFALPVLVGYAPELMQTKVWDVVNLAYLFALSQFIMAWTVAALYVRAAGRFDKLAESIRARLKLK